MPAVLLVEDNPGDARLVVEHLREKSNLVEDYIVTHVERVSEAVKILKSDTNIDIILSDITLPDSRGEDTLSALNTAADQLPIIFMTGTNDEGLAISAINKGAQDYLVKGRIDSEILLRAIQYAIERKRFQNDLKKVTESDKLNQERIKLLADQKRQLIKLNHSKDDFISIASHQLRTPATAVKQFIGMIVEGMAGEVNADQLELLQYAYESNERQLSVINELLKTAQLDSSKVKLSFQKCGINELIQSSVAEISRILELKHQTIILNLADNYEVLADREELKLVLDNLIENASKYTPKSKRITVSTYMDNLMMHIAVADEGVGISKENTKVIFEKFSRIDNELSDTVQGSGLGLYWVKKIIKLHKGTIKVTSELGKGSTFTVSLPL